MELLIWILTTIFVLTGTLFFINYVLIKKYPGYSGVLIAISCLSLSSFLLGNIISLSASMASCGRANKRHALKMGLKTLVYAIIGYILVYYIAFLREPFMSLIPNQQLAYTIGQSFIVTLNTITATIINFYSSVKISCRKTAFEIEKNLRPLDKYLNKKPRPKKDVKM